MEPVAIKPAEWSDEEWTNYQDWLGTLLPFDEGATHLVAIKGDGAAKEETPIEDEEEAPEEEPEEEEGGDNVASERERQ